MKYTRLSSDVCFSPISISQLVMAQRHRVEQVVQACTQAFDDHAAAIAAKIIVAIQESEFQISWWNLDSQSKLEAAVNYQMPRHLDLKDHPKHGSKAMRESTFLSLVDGHFRRLLQDKGDEKLACRQREWHLNFLQFAFTKDDTYTLYGLHAFQS